MVIQKFVTHLSKVKQVSLRITTWPDKVNRSKRDIDALVEGGSVRIAIEHTTIDTVPDQRRDSARFMKVFGKIDTELSGEFDARIRLTVPFGAIPTGFDRSTLRRTLTQWLRKTIPSLPNGFGCHEVPGLPFKIHINKRSSERPSLRVGRFDPEDKTLPQRLHAAINNKVGKLAPYKKSGFETILLIESDDIALMNLTLMQKSVKTALGDCQPIGLDEIWYADTAIPQDLDFWKILSKQ